MKSFNFTWKGTAYTGHAPEPLRPLARAIGWLKKPDAGVAEAPVAGLASKGLRYFPFVKRVAVENIEDRPGTEALLAPAAQGNENASEQETTKRKGKGKKPNTTTDLLRNAAFGRAISGDAAMMALSSEWTNPPEGQIKRAPVDILIDWASDLDKELSEGRLRQAHADLLSKAKAAFFSGARSAEDIKTVLNDAAEYCTANKLDAQNRLLDTLIRKLPDAAYIAELQSQPIRDVLDKWESALSAFSPEEREKSSERHAFFDGAQRALKEAHDGKLSNNEISASLKRSLDAYAHSPDVAELHGFGELTRLAREIDTMAVRLEGPLLHRAASSRVFETAFATALLDIQMPESFSRSMELIAAQLKTVAHHVAPDDLNDMIGYLRDGVIFIHGKASSPLRDLDPEDGSRDEARMEKALYSFLDGKKVTGDQCAALMYVARNIVLLAHGFGNPGNPQWMLDREAYDGQVREVSRIKVPATVDDTPGNKNSPAGLTLPFQPAVAHIAGAEWDERPLTRYDPDFLSPSPALKHALHSGEIHVAGVSGSAATLLYMLDAFRQDRPNIDIKAGVLAMAMYMIHMGAHSLYEIMWVVHDLKDMLGLDVGHVDRHGNFVMEMGKVLHISDNPEWITMLETAAQTGWETAIAYHRKHSKFRV